MQTRQTEEFRRWLAKLRDRRAQAAIARRIVRIEAGNLGLVESVGDEVSEAKIDYGPGYRLYFTVRRKRLVILLVGGDKGSQRRDIARAKALAARVEDEGLTEDENDQDQPI